MDLKEFREFVLAEREQQRKENLEKMSVFLDTISNTERKEN